jgi:hypothetical protein
MTSYSNDRAAKGLMVATLAAALMLACGSARAQDGSRGMVDQGMIDVGLDQATLVHLQRPAADIIVGNPSIADVSVQNSKLLVVTGKSFGKTNIIVVGTDGSEILNSGLSVDDPVQGLVTVHKGTDDDDAFTVYCSPRCNAPLAIGDNKDYFNKVNGQIGAKQSLGSESASTVSGQ